MMAPTMAMTLIFGMIVLSIIPAGGLLTWLIWRNRFTAILVWALGLAYIMLGVALYIGWDTLGQLGRL